MDDIDLNAIEIAIKKFSHSLSKIEKDSPDAFALVIFVNGCYDTKSFASNKFSALVHYQKARSSALILEMLLEKGEATFNQAVTEARNSLITSKVVNQNLCLSH